MFNVNETSISLDTMVRRSGWAVQFVGAGEGQPSYAYTVGLLRQYGHPEFVAVGVPPGAAASLNHLGARVRDGEVFEVGDWPVGALPDLRTELIAVDMFKSREELLAAWNLNEQPVPALQMVWPDADNRLPWEAGYSLPRSAQPLWGKRDEPLAVVRRTADGSWISRVPKAPGRPVRPSRKRRSSG